MDWLIGYGVEQIISTGTCGVLADIEENAFLVPVRALRDERTSYHYIDANRVALNSLIHVLMVEDLRSTKSATITISTPLLISSMADALRVILG